jgi:hypothetical protein
MVLRYTQVHDEFMTLLDNVQREPDEAARLAILQSLYRDALTRLVASRNEAAYDLRTRYSVIDSEIVTGIARQDIDRWARRHMARNGLPPLKRMNRVDLSNAIDISSVMGEVNKRT